MSSVPTTEPTEFRSGDTVKWTRSLSDYPASDGWSLSYVFINADRKMSVAATADGDDFAVTITATVSSGYAAGRFSWVAYVTKATERYTIDNGTVDVLANLSAQSMSDTRSHARKVLDAIEAVLEKRATLDQENYTHNGLSIARTPVADLLVLRDRYRWDVRQEDNAERLRRGLGSNTVIRTRF